VFIITIVQELLGVSCHEFSFSASDRTKIV